MDPNQQRIEEYQRRIQEQAQRLAAEQAQLQLTKEAVAQGASATGAPSGSIPPSRGPNTRSTAPVRPTRDELTLHVSDNVAFSKDRGVAAAPPAPAEAPPIPAWPPFVLPATTPSITTHVGRRCGVDERGARDRRPRLWHRQVPRRPPRGPTP